MLENWDSATSGHKQIGGSHDVHWIRPGLPGAGHIMVFNNGQYLYQRTPQSSILEINPFLDAQRPRHGQLRQPARRRLPTQTLSTTTRTTTAPMISKQIVWSYRPSTATSVLQPHRLGARQRLPNGNTFICSDTEGHFFEVTAEGELVWEYINPVTRDGTVKVLATCCR